MAVDLPFPEEEVPQLLPCVVANAPASPSDACRVTIPDMATTRTFRVNWEPHGGTYPAAILPSLGFNS